MVPEEGRGRLEIEDPLHDNVGEVGQEDHADAEARLTDEEQLVVELVGIAPSVSRILVFFC